MPVSLLTGKGSSAAAVACMRWPLVTAATGFLADKPEANVVCLQILAYR